MLHACFVGARELPTDVALYEVDSLFPVIRLDHGGKHNEVGFNDLVCDRIIWIDDGEANVPMIGFIWNFRSRPIWFICENHVFEEGVRVFDFFQELFLGPELAHVHGITVEFFIRDCPAWDLPVNQFVPDCRFGKGDVGVALCEDVNDGFGCILNVLVFGFVCECDREVVLFGPPG